MPQTKFPVCPSLNRHRGNIYVVRTPSAPNFSLSLKINLCDLRDLCVSQFPRSGGEGWSLLTCPQFPKTLQARKIEPGRCLAWLGARTARIEEERNAGSNQDTGQRAGK
jgi:hypothetical protein